MDLEIFSVWHLESLGASVREYHNHLPKKITLKRHLAYSRGSLHGETNEQSSHGEDPLDLPECKI